MAIKPRVANAPLTDELGFCTGELADITETVFEDPKSGSETDQLLFDFVTPGKSKPIVLKIWTGLTVSPEKQDFSKSKTGEYSKLTKIVLALNLLEETELNDPEVVEALGEKLEGIKGQKVKFKLTKPNGKRLSTIDLDSLQLIK
jgi:hypothetical protein